MTHFFMPRHQCALLLCLLLLITQWSLRPAAQAQSLIPDTLKDERTLHYGSYLGGNSDDWVRDITSDAQGYLYLTGYTYSAQLGGTQHPHYGKDDIFVTKLSPDGRQILFTTIFGGSGSEEGYGIAVQGAGENARIWVTGYTNSADFLTVTPFQATYGGSRDAFIAELSPTGEIRFSSYMGSWGSDEARAVAIDNNGDVHIAGALTGGFFNKVDGQSYQLLYSRMLSDQDVIAEDIAIDRQGNLYFTGSVRSATWPTEHAVQTSCGQTSAGSCTTDAFLLKLNPAGDTILFSSYLGGSEVNDGNGSDAGMRIAVDGQGNLFVAGETFATDFPTANAFQSQKHGPANFSELFISKLRPAGEGYVLAFSSYLGGEWSEYLGDLAPYNGGIMLTGLTDSEQFPRLAATQPQLGNGICNLGGSERYCSDAFVTQVDADGALLFSSYLGGEADDSGVGVTVDGAGTVTVVGRTESFAFPATANAQQPKKSLSKDLFVAQLGVPAPALPTPTPTAQPTAQPTATPTPTTQPAPNQDTLSHRLYLPVVRR